MDQQDGVAFAQGGAGVYHLLAAALHFGVVPLHGGEVQIRQTGAGRHAGGGAPAQADQHGRAAEHHQGCVRREVLGLHMVGAHRSEAAGDHHRLVVAAQHGGVDGVRLLKGAEVAAQGRAPVFVVEGRPADRPLQHDVQGGSHVRRLRVRPFPRLRMAGNAQMGGGEAHQAGLGLGAPANGPFVAYLAAAAGGGPWIGGDAGGMVVRLHLHQDGGVLLHIAVATAARVAQEATAAGAANDRGVVRIGAQDAGAADGGGGVADHLKQGMGLGLAVDGPAGVEDLVAAVLGVGLGEHHQFDVGGVPAKLGEGGRQIVDLVRGQRQAEVAVGFA